MVTTFYIIVYWKEEKDFVGYSICFIYFKLAECNFK